MFAISMRYFISPMVAGLASSWDEKIGVYPFLASSSKIGLNFDWVVLYSVSGGFIFRVYQPRQLPRFGSLYLIALIVILFPFLPSPFQVPAFCSMRTSFDPVHHSQAIATWPYGLDDVLSRKTISPSLGIAVVVFVTRSHFVPINGLPVSQPLSADHQNVQIGFHCSCANVFTQATHCAQSFSFSFVVFPIHFWIVAIIYFFVKVI